MKIVTCTTSAKRRRNISSLHGRITVRPALSRRLRYAEIRARSALATLRNISSVTTSNSSKSSALVSMSVKKAVANLIQLAGTFARVWLAKLQSPQNGDSEKVFALKVLKKIDSKRTRSVSASHHTSDAVNSHQIETSRACKCINTTP